MAAQPGGIGGFGDVAGGKSEHGQRGILRAGGQAEAIEPKKQAGAEKGGTFVAVDEGMVLGESEGVGGSAIENVRLAVGSQVFRAGQRRIEQAFVTDAGSAAMQYKAFAMQQQQRAAVDPDEQATWPVRGRCRGTRA